MLIDRNGPWRLGNDLAAVMRARSEMDRLFERLENAREPFPAVNVYGNGEELLITAEVPGLDRESIDVSIHEDLLTISGKREDASGQKDVCHRRERGSGSFSRSFALPFGVDVESATASLERGVLQLRLPRSMESLPKKISVAGS